MATSLGAHHVSTTQKLLTQAGHALNYPARVVGRNVDLATRPAPEGSSFLGRAARKLKHGAVALVSLPFSIVGSPLAFASYFTASIVGRGRLEYIAAGAEDALQSFEGKTIQVMSLGACFQDPWSALHGIAPPFEAVGDHPSRIAAIVNEIAERTPDIFFGQVFEDVASQNEAIRLLRSQGYNFFIRDMGSNHSVSNNSGLFVASKRALADIEFCAFPLEDRVGLSRWSSQGALAFTISLQGQTLRLINTHLNYHPTDEAQTARNRQFKEHVISLVDTSKPFALVGNFNCDTRQLCENAGASQLENPFVGTTTYVTDHEESIDGMIYDSSLITILDPQAQRLRHGDQPLSEHFAISATLEIV